MQNKLPLLIKIMSYGMKLKKKLVSVPWDGAVMSNYYFRDEEWTLVVKVLAYPDYKL